MKKEVDLRSLLVGTIETKIYDKPINSFKNSQEDNIVGRQFETGRRWSRSKKTSFIESIYLKCAIQPILRFINDNHTVIIDGYNRYQTICEFLEGKLKLDPKGLKQLKFLENKTYTDLMKNETDNYFLNCNAIKIIDYKYYNKYTNKEKMDEKEEIEIERYLYESYNAGLRLEVEEIQKAQFCNDEVTQKIEDKIKTDPNFLSQLETLHLYNGRRKKNKLYNILLNCRLLIASTYSNINDFCLSSTIEDRIDKNYLPNIMYIDKEKIFSDFLLNIQNITENLIQTQKWLKYENLHTKPFLDATYWLVSVIRKDKINSNIDFDFMSYLEYFGEKESQENNFNPYQSHYRKNIYKKYALVAEYYEKEYGISMSKYFEVSSNQIKINNSINTIEELQKKHFNYITRRIKVRDLLEELKNGLYNIRPFYQRFETMNIALSSRVIESLLLGLELPDILVYECKRNGRYVKEIVDGQQRLLAILGFLESEYRNEKGEIEYSNKNGYVLTELRVLFEKNNLKYKSRDKQKTLSKFDVQKIMDSEISFIIVTENENGIFSAVDHFVRLNKNNYIIKENSYIKWNLISDREIINYEKKITEKYMGTILPKSNNQKTASIITLKLAYLFYYKKYDEINFQNYSNKKITLWLKKFNIEKNKLLNHEEDKIDCLRKEYYIALDDVQRFYNKINLFLEKTNISIRDLFQLDKSANISVKNYYYLFIFLAQVSKEDLMNYNLEMFKILNQFYSDIKLYSLEQGKLIKKIEYVKEQIRIRGKNKNF